MRAVISSGLVLVAVSGCTGSTVEGGIEEPASSSADQLPGLGLPGVEDNALVPAAYPECDRGSVILHYLATGDNGGIPELDQLFADYVGVPEPQARARASDWIETCNAGYAEAEAAASSAQAQADASAAQASHEAAVEATTERSCASIGGVANEGWLGGCNSMVEGNPSGQSGANCASAWVGVDEAGVIQQSDLDFSRQHYPGCFTG